MLALDPRDIYDKNSIILKNKRNGCHTFSKAYSTRDKVMFELFTEKMNAVFSEGCCHTLSIRPVGGVQISLEG